MNATIEQRLLKYSDEYPELVQKRLSSFYVEFFNSGCATVEEAFGLFVKSKKIMSQGDFNVCKWCSNSQELRTLIKDCKPSGPSEGSGCTPEVNIQEEDMTYTKATLGNDNFPINVQKQKVLGLTLNFYSDEFVIELRSLAQLAEERSLKKETFLGLLRRALTFGTNLSSCQRDESVVSRTVQMQNWVG